MVSSFLSLPGSKIGPCEDECIHTDCAWQRSVAEWVCEFCGDPIGYETNFYNEGDSKEPNYVHAICLEDFIEQEIRAKHEPY